MMPNHPVAVSDEPTLTSDNTQFYLYVACDLTLKYGLGICPGYDKHLR